MKKIFLIILSLVSLLGCSALNEKQANEAVNLIEEKYGESFIATHIGERYGTKTNDTISTIVHPEGEENILFKVITSKDGALIADGYTPALISEQFNQLIKEELKTFGIESETKTVIMQADSSANTDASITIEEYVEQFEPGYFSAHMIVKDTGDIKGEHFEQALLKAYETGKETIFQVQIKVISEEDYDEAAIKYRQLLYASSSWFRDYDLIDEIDAVADANGYNFIFHSDPRYGG